MLDNIFDIVVCVMLAATIWHLALVQYRLRAFRAERDRLQAFVTALDLTVERAETALRRLKTLEAKQQGETPVERPRSLRQRTPEELLRAARLAAGVNGKRSDAGEEAPPAKGAGALASSLQTALGG